MSRRWIGVLLAILLVLGAAAAVVVLTRTPGTEVARVSEFGVYRGYSEAEYRYWTRQSLYVEVRDGTRLAVDIFRPSRNGVDPVETALPVVFSAERYVRATWSGSGMKTTLDAYPYLKTLLQHGYVVAAADVRGTGASFGVFSGDTDMTEAHDLYDLTEWFAARPWCNGNVGMYGASYRGNNQYWAAATAPPHLKCLFAEAAPFDAYYSGHPNGVFWDRYLREWAAMTRDLDINAHRITVPVDDDPGGSLLAAAVAEHAANADTYEVAKSMPYRDSESADPDSAVALAAGDSILPLVQASGIPVYHWTGWFDYFAFNQPTWFPNLEQPQKMAIGPWVHVDRYGPTDLAAIEHLRWYDCWLKGIDNGITQEAPVNYFTLGAPSGQEWQSAGDWPLPGVEPTRYYFDEGPSGSVESLNDGSLSPGQPGPSSGRDLYTVEVFTLSLADRWSATSMESLRADWRELDSVSLTYTTPPLEEDMVITGCPVAHLWVSADVADADFFVYLEEVSLGGGSTTVSDGLLRASHRSVGTPPWDNAGLPWHRSCAADVEPLTPGEPVELAIGLAPTSNIFERGHRIRVTITCNDFGDMFDTSRESGAEITLYRSSTMASYISLPVAGG